MIQHIGNQYIYNSFAVRVRLTKSNHFFEGGSCSTASWTQIFSWGGGASPRFCVAGRGGLAAASPPCSKEFVETTVLLTAGARWGGFDLQFSDRFRRITENFQKNFNVSKQK